MYNMQTVINSCHDITTFLLRILHVINYVRKV